jgi:hypothetical protein
VRGRALVFAAVAAVGVAAAVPACHSSEDAATLAALAAGCSLDSDCTSPLVCVFQTCHVECNTSADCVSRGLGECVEGDKPYRVCQNPTEEDCVRTSDCPGEEVCASDERCRDACVTSKDCGAGQECTSGVCAEPAELVDGGLAVVDGGSGQSCVYASQCPGNLVCLESHCALECITDRDCPLSYSCELDNRCHPPGDESGGTLDGSMVANDAGDAGEGATDGGIEHHVCDGPCDYFTLATGQAAVSLSVASGYVYWGNSEPTASIRRAPLDGSAVVSTLIDGLASAPTSVASDGVSVFYLASTSEIDQVPVAGGSASTLVSGLSSASTLRVIAGYLYFTQTDGLYRMQPTLGAVPARIVTPLPQSYGVVGSTLYTVQAGSPATYAASALDGSAPVTTTLPYSPNGGFAVAAGSFLAPVYVSMGMSEEEEVLAIPLGGGTSQSLYAESTAAPPILVGDGTAGYFGNESGGGVIRVRPGETAAALSSYTGAVTAFDQDDTFVYLLAAPVSAYVYKMYK